VIKILLDLSRGGVINHVRLLRELKLNPSAPSSLSTGVVDYSDVHQDQQQEVSIFLKETFFKRVRHGYTKDKASESAVCSGRLHIDAQGLQWTSNEQLFIPHWDNLLYECFESVHKHPFAGHFGAQRTLKKATQLYSWCHIPARGVI
jgi:hypothetical protein